jgi:hypothetical protein
VCATVEKRARPERLLTARESEGGKGHDSRERDGEGERVRQRDQERAAINAWKKEALMGGRVRLDTPPPHSAGGTGLPSSSGLMEQPAVQSQSFSFFKKAAMLVSDWSEVINADNQLSTRTRLTPGDAHYLIGLAMFLFAFATGAPPAQLLLNCRPARITPTSSNYCFLHDVLAPAVLRGARSPLGPPGLPGSQCLTCSGSLYDQRCVHEAPSFQPLHTFDVWPEPAPIEALSLQMIADDVHHMLDLCAANGGAPVIGKGSVEGKSWAARAYRRQRMDAHPAELSRSVVCGSLSLCPLRNSYVGLRSVLSPDRHCCYQT